MHKCRYRLQVPTPCGVCGRVTTVCAATAFCDFVLEGQSWNIAVYHSLRVLRDLYSGFDTVSGAGQRGDPPLCAGVRFDIVCDRAGVCATVCTVGTVCIAVTGSVCCFVGLCMCV